MGALVSGYYSEYGDGSRGENGRGFEFCGRNASAGSGSSGSGFWNGSDGLKSAGDGAAAAEAGWFEQRQGADAETCFVALDAAATLAMIAETAHTGSETTGIPVAFATGSLEASKGNVYNTQTSAAVLTACVNGDPAAGNFLDASVTPVRTTPTPIEVVHTRPLAAWQMGTTSWDDARAPCAGPGVVGG